MSVSSVRLTTPLGWGERLLHQAKSSPKVEVMASLHLSSPRGCRQGSTHRGLLTVLGGRRLSLDSADLSLAQLPGKGGDSVSQSESWELPHAVRKTTWEI